MEHVFYHWSGTKIHAEEIPPRPRHLDHRELAELRQLLGEQVTARGAELLTALGWSDPGGSLHARVRAVGRARGGGSRRSGRAVRLAAGGKSEREACSPGRTTRARFERGHWGDAWDASADKIHVPLAGLQVGERLRWLNRQIALAVELNASADHLEADPPGRQRR